MARIVVVDDDLDFLTLAREVLTSRGHQTAGCADAAAALEVIREEQPELVLLDLRMQTPRGGWEILEAMKLHAVLRDVPVILCTAAPDELDSRRAWLEASDVAVLVKPFALEDLESLVDEALERGRGRHSRLAL
jgi:CheY-like chemotaxis protein